MSTQLRLKDRLKYEGSDWNPNPQRIQINIYGFCKILKHILNFLTNMIFLNRRTPNNIGTAHCVWLIESCIPISSKTKYWLLVGLTLHAARSRSKAWGKRFCVVERLALSEAKRACTVLLCRCRFRCRFRELAAAQWDSRSYRRRSRGARQQQ